MRDKAQRTKKTLFAARLFSETNLIADIHCIRD